MNLHQVASFAYEGLACCILEVHYYRSYLDSYLQSLKRVDTSFISMEEASLSWGSLEVGLAQRDTENIIHSIFSGFIFPSNRVTCACEEEVNMRFKEHLHGFYL